MKRHLVALLLVVALGIDVGAFAAYVYLWHRWRPCVGPMCWPE